MTQRDRIGLAVLLALFALLILALFWAVKRPSGPLHRPEDSPIIKQRIINLQKGKR